MREILFRGKRTDNGEWVFGGYYFENNKHFIIRSVRYKPDTRDWDTADYYENNPTYRKEFVEVIPESVSEFTGLTDKNGTKIFEGDIVKYKDARKFSDDDEMEEAEEQYLCTNVVKFNNGRFFPLPQRCDFEDYYYSYGLYDFEVVGNIHDNSELLRKDG